MFNGSQQDMLGSRITSGETDPENYERHRAWLNSAAPATKR